jgi:hypothetical protein
MKKRITLDERQVAQVEALAGLLTQEQLADYFGVHRHTMDHIMERQPEVLAAYRKGKATVLARVAKNLVTQALEGNLGAIIFYLKTQGRWSTVQDEQPQELLAMRIERVIVRAEERLTSEQNHATN